MLMAAMNSDVNDNHLALSIAGDAALVPNVAVDAIKSVIVMMAVMKSHVATVVMVMILFLVVMVESVPGHAMASLSAMIDLMNRTVLLEMFNFQVANHSRYHQ